MSSTSSLTKDKGFYVPVIFGAKQRTLTVEKPRGRNHTRVVISIIHVADKLDDLEKRRITESLKNMPGVIAAQFRPIHKHMLSIAFYPGKIKAVDMVKFIRMKGHPARLLGC